MLKILGRTSSINVRKVLWTCDELDLAYEQEDWGPPFRQLDTPDFLKLNPNAQIPVLIDGDFVLWESSAIMRYLANRYGEGRLMPTDPFARARVDQWMDWQGSDLPPLWGYAFRALSRKQPGYDDPSRIAISLERWNAKMAILEDALGAGRSHIAGGDFSLADICIALGIHRWRCTPIPARPAFPQVEAYMDRLTARPAFARWCHPDRP